MKIRMVLLVFLGVLGAMLGAAENSTKLVEANALYSAKNYLTALEYYKEASIADPGNVMAIKGQADCLNILGRRQEALLAYNKALQLAPADSIIRLQAAKLQAELRPLPIPMKTPNAPKVLPEVQESGGWSPFWRSAIVPGLGQWYDDRRNSSLLLGGTTWVMMGGVAGTYFMGAKAFDDYERAQTGVEATERFDQAYSWYLANQTFYILFGAAYVYNLVDAALGGPRQINNHVKVGLVPNMQGGAEAKW
jgi:tetratricopeptide (TPR) repeat protein